MSDMDDKYYYKFRSIAYEIDYIVKSVKETPGGLTDLIQNENKRANVKKILAQVQTDIKSIQDTFSPEFNPEF